eukprot:1364070-Rhodomonas_salina.4
MRTDVMYARRDTAMPSITKTIPLSFQSMKCSCRMTLKVVCSPLKILDPAVALGLSPAAAAVFTSSRGTKMKNTQRRHPTTFEIAQRFPPELHQAILLRDEGLTALPR